MAAGDFCCQSQYLQAALARQSWRYSLRKRHFQCLLRPCTASHQGLQPLEVFGRPLESTYTCCWKLGKLPGAHCWPPSGNPFSGSCGLFWLLNGPPYPYMLPGARYARACEAPAVPIQSVPRADMPTAAPANLVTLATSMSLQCQCSSGLSTDAQKGLQSMQSLCFSHQPFLHRSMAKLVSPTFCNVITS